MHILVVNAGSSSLKLRILDDADRLMATKDLSRLEVGDLRDALDAFLDENPPIDAIGHRVVHGGSVFTQPVLLDADSDAALEALAGLAPLHNPPSLAAIESLRSLRPNLPQVACFDTTFHADMPAKATTYAVPKSWRQRWDIRRFGFHGLSHAWASRRAGEMLGHDRAQLRLVTAHLGAGASLAAVCFGRSVDTTMGFTPMEGLVMATRSGSVDPGMLLWLMEHESLSASELADALEHRSGLLGLAGSADMREIVERAAAGEPLARLALDVYIHRLRAGIAAMAATLGGLDALVFTGGVGEHSAEVRAQAAAGLAFLGVSVDQARNRDSDGDAEIGADDAAASTLVITAREDLEIADQVTTLLSR